MSQGVRGTWGVHTADRMSPTLRTCPTCGTHEYGMTSYMWTCRVNVVCSHENDEIEEERSIP